MSTTKSFEDLQTKHETEETPESHLLHVHMPDGFARKHVCVKLLEDASLTVYGEKPLKNNKMGRFNVEHQVPEYCDIQGMKTKFVGQTITVVMPKDPNKVPKEEPKQPSKQEAAAQETEPKPEENEKEDNPQSATTKDDNNQEKTTTVDHQVHKTTIESKEGTPRRVYAEGEIGNSRKDTVTKVETKEEAPPTPPKATQEPISPNGKDGISQTKVESKEPRKATAKSRSQKGKEGNSHKDTVTTVAKFLTEEKFVKEESEEHPKKTLETEKESKEEGEGSAKVESFSTKKINGKIDCDVVEKKDMPEYTSTIRTRIKEVVASASQAVTSLAKRFNEEDKQKLIYMGAASLVVALGVYATSQGQIHKPNEGGVTINFNIYNCKSF